MTKTVSSRQLTVTVSWDLLCVASETLNQHNLKHQLPGLLSNVYSNIWHEEHVLWTLVSIRENVVDGSLFSVKEDWDGNSSPSDTFKEVSWTSFTRTRCRFCSRRQNLRTFISGVELMLQDLHLETNIKTHYSKNNEIRRRRKSMLSSWVHVVESNGSRNGVKLQVQDLEVLIIIALEAKETRKWHHLWTTQVNSTWKTFWVSILSQEYVSTPSNETVKLFSW